MKKKSIFKKTLEYIFSKKGSIICLVFGCLALLSNFLLPNKYFNIVLNCVAGLLGGIYAVYPCHLYRRKIVEFDWQLINGHFLQKVCCLVLFLPFTLWFFSLPLCSPKALVYEDNLYHEITAEITDTVYVNDSLCCVRAKANQTLPDSIRNKQADPSFFWGVYYHFIDPGNQHMTTTLGGRVIAAIISIFGMFLLNGLLVSSIIGWIDRRKEKWLKGEIKYDKFLKKYAHYVIIGGNDMVAGIVKQLFVTIDGQKDLLKTYILIQTSRDVENFRRELFSDLTEDQQKRVIIYYGSRTSKEDIASLMLENAKEVYILGEDTRTDDIESYHDTMNMACLKLVSDQVKDVAAFQNVNEDNRLVCRVMFEYQSTFNIFQVTDIDGDKIKFLPFNYYEMWAQQVLVCQELGKDVTKYTYLPLEGVDGIKSNDNSFVHFVVVGMSRMGLAMAIEVAHLAHYTNFETNKKRTRITFIDSAMDQEKYFFMGRFKEMFALARHRDVSEATPGIYGNTENYPWADPFNKDKYNPLYIGDYLGEDFVDVEWEFVNGSIENPNVQKYLVDAASNPDAKLTIAVCLPENSRAIAAAAYLPDKVYSSEQTLQVLVYQRMNEELLRQINENKRYHGKLKAFGMNKGGYNASLIELSEYIEKEINDAYYKFKNEQKVKKQNCPFYKIKENVANADASSDPKNGESANNTNDEPTKEKPKSAKWWSNKYNIYTMWTKFRCMDADSESIKNKDFVFGVKDLENLGKMEHNRWVVEQLLLRYRPLTQTQQEKAKIVCLCSSDKEKGRLKSDEYAHLDICSNAKLDKLDYNVSKLDQALIQVLPGAYREYLEEKGKKDNSRYE